MGSGDPVKPSVLAEADANDRRCNEREEAGSEWPLHVVHSASDKIIPSKLLDVSDGGLGLKTAVELNEGDQVCLVTLKDRVDLEVMWCVPSSDGYFACGLKRHGQTKNDLVKMFSRLLSKPSKS